MPTGYLPATMKDYTNPPQYVVEGTTAATFGVQPTSPTYIQPNLITDFTIDQQITKADVLELGNYDVVNAVKTGEVNAFSIKANITDTTLAKFGFNAPSGSGTVEESLAFIVGKDFDGTDNYRTMLGCRPISTTLSAERGLWELDMTFVCREITDWSTSAPAGATLLTASSAQTALSHVDASTDPFSWNATAYDVLSFSATTTFELGLVEVMGKVNIEHSRVAHRRNTGSATIYQKNTSIQVDYAALTKRAILMDVENGTSQFSDTDCRITSYSSNPSAANTDIIKEDITWEAENRALS